MADKRDKGEKKQSGSQSDEWYLISIDRLKQIGLIVFILIVGAASYYYIKERKGNPRTRAQDAIADARQALNALAASPDYATQKSEFERAQARLEEATTLLSAAKFEEAKSAALESASISRAAISGGVEDDTDARFLTVEGDVQYQKASSSDWKRADVRIPLVNGDWVKTGDRASAELIFQNGSLYTIGPNALLEIYSAVIAGSTKKTNSVQMKVGSVEVATVTAGSTVRTPGSQVEVGSESTTQVGIDPEQRTSVLATRGSASVSPAQGGEAVRLAAGEKVVASPAGALSAVRKVALPPALAGPPDNQVFSIGADKTVRFDWQPQPGAAAYLIQVSRSRLFSALEINARREKNSAEASLASEGTFYWRVASIGPDGEVGPASPFRRFRVSGSGQFSASATDTKPPALTLKAPFNIGGQFYIIEGTTEPGATVFINDEEVDVDSSGAFKKLISFNKLGQNAVVVKAVDPAGNPTVQSQTVMVEE